MVPCFFFHGKVVPLLVMDSENVSINRLSVDYERSWCTEARVVKTDDRFTGKTSLNDVSLPQIGHGSAGQRSEDFHMKAAESWSEGTGRVHRRSGRDPFSIRGGIVVEKACSKG